VKLLRKNTKNSVKVVVDTSTFFSAIYTRKGNEAYIFELADKGLCSIYIVDYVLEELKEVFKRKNLDFALVSDLLDTYNNIHVCELVDLEEGEIKSAKKLIDDKEDRPIFVFALRMIKEHENIYFVSGDKGFFKEKVKKSLNYKVVKTKEFIKIVKPS